MQDIVILGNGAAGIHALLSIRKYDAKSRVSIISDDEPFFYSRPEITQLLEDPSGTRHLQLPVSGEVLESTNRIYQRVEGLDAKNGRVMLADGTALSYDKLIFATGSRPKTVSIIGVPDSHVFNPSDCRRRAKNRPASAGNLEPCYPRRRLNRIENSAYPYTAR
jgi:NADH dehydrogenase FAD-containing subunit